MENGEQNISEETRKRIISEYMSELARMKIPTKGYGSDSERASKCGKMKNPRKGFGSNRAKAVEMARKSWETRRRRAAEKQSQAEEGK